MLEAPRGAGDKEKLANATTLESPADQVFVPNLIGQSIGQAQESLAKTGLKARADNASPKDRVAQQAPLSGWQRPGAEVRLIAAAPTIPNPPLVLVPRVVGTTFGEAKKHLEAIKLIATTSGNPERGVVLTQSPAAGTKVRQNTPIVLAFQSSKVTATGADDKQKTTKTNEEPAKTNKQKIDEAAAKVTKRKIDEAAAKVTKRKIDEAAAKAAKRKIDEAAAKVTKRKIDEAAAKVTQRKIDEAAAKVTKRKIGEAAAKVTQRKIDEAAAKVTGSQTNKKVTQNSMQQNTKAVGTGNVQPVQRRAVPDLIGQSAAQAERTLSSTSFRYRTTGNPRGHVVGQSPRAGTVLPMGATVNLQLR